MEAITVTREACYALRNLMVEAGKIRISPPHVQSRKWGAPGFYTDLDLDGVDLGPMCELPHVVDSVNFDDLVVFFERTLNDRGCYPSRMAHRLKLLFPSIKWAPLNHPAEHKARIFQAAQLASRLGANLELGTDKVVLELPNGWRMIADGSAAFYGTGEPIRRVFKGFKKLSWRSALLLPPGGEKEGYPYINAFGPAMTEILPKYAKEIDLLCRFVTHDPNNLALLIMEMFDAPRSFLAGTSGGFAKRGSAGIYMKMSQIVDRAKTYPIRDMVKLLHHQFTAEEVYRLFGCDNTFHKVPIPKVVKEHFLDVIADLEAGYIRTRQKVNAEKSGTVSDEVEEFFAIQELLR